MDLVALIESCANTPPYSSNDVICLLRVSLSSVVCVRFLLHEKCDKFYYSVALVVVVKIVCFFSPPLIFPEGEHGSQWGPSGSISTRRAKGKTALPGPRRSLPRAWKPRRLRLVRYHQGGSFYVVMFSFFFFFFSCLVFWLHPYIPM